MSIDLIKALNASGAEPARSESSRNGSPFPAVLESKFASDSQQKSASQDAGTRESTSAKTTTQSGTVQSGAAPFSTSQSVATRSSAAQSEPVDSESVKAEGANNDLKSSEPLGSEWVETTLAEKALLPVHESPSTNTRDPISADSEEELAELAAESGGVGASVSVMVAEVREALGLTAD
jgi:hypothetical protein